MNSVITFLHRQNKEICKEMSELSPLPKAFCLSAWAPNCTVELLGKASDTFQIRILYLLYTILPPFYDWEIQIKLAK